MSEARRSSSGISKRKKQEQEVWTNLPGKLKSRKSEDQNVFLPPHSCTADLPMPIKAIRTIPLQTCTQASLRQQSLTEALFLPTWASVLTSWQLPLTITGPEQQPAIQPVPRLYCYIKILTHGACNLLNVVSNALEGVWSHRGYNFV